MDDLDTIEDKIATIEDKIATIMRELRKLHAIRRDLYERQSTIEDKIANCSESEANKLFEITRKLEHRFNQE